LRIYNTDSTGAEQELTLEYELPINFHFAADLSSTFCAVQIQEQEFLGFHFANAVDKQSFNVEMKNLVQKLTLTKQQIIDIHTQAKKTLDDDFAAQLNESIQIDKLLRGTDMETQAKELRKLLIVAGVDVETDISNPEVMGIIGEVLKNFNPMVPEDQDEAVFDTAFRHFKKAGDR